MTLPRRLVSSLPFPCQMFKFPRHFQVSNYLRSGHPAGYSTVDLDVECQHANEIL